MKAILRKICLFAMILSFTIACKKSNGNETTGSEVGNGENYGNEQNQSDATKTGQHIGATADSTTVDGERGTQSNN